MIPLESVSFETFAPLEGRGFVVHSGGMSVDLVLASVKLLGHRHPGATRDPFSLVYRGVRGLRLPQGSYRLFCDTLGEIEIFITQVADGPQGSEFEAIFT